MRNQLKTFVGFNVLTLIIFGYFYLQKFNLEFLLYIGAIVAFGTLVLGSDRHFKYSILVLGSLTAWSLMHLGGGIIPINGDVLYNLMLYTFSAEYQILKYDQFVHVFGFFTATLLLAEVIAPSLKKKALTNTSILIILWLAGLGAGGVNEILEFTATVLVPDTNVGGYINTSLDLVANAIGAFAAVMVIKFKH